MIIERKTMNILFYLGIIVPTIITVILFVLFLVCWYRIKVRRDVLHKKHDPHGKMRQLGLSRVPPPPPIFVRQEFQRLQPIGEDNTAYQVSRSPSAEQDQQGGRPGLYHAPHDSGLSEMSEFQCKDRPHSQASQGSTDSEDSGFRSSRSGQYHPSVNNQLQDIPLLKPIKSNKDGLDQTFRLSQCDKLRIQNGGQTSEWPMTACGRTLNSSARNLNSSARNLNSKNLNSSSRNLNSSSRTMHPSASMHEMQQTSRTVNLNDISTHISWKYLQNLASNGHSDSGPSVTMAQVHCPSANQPTLVESNGDLLGYSVV